MCTVTIIPMHDGAGYRLVTNRDERPTRERALAPRWVPEVLPGVRALWPIDGLAGGTWVGAHEGGLSLAILNANLPDPGPTPHPSRRLSRGGVIPRVISSRSAPEVVERLPGIEIERFDPFRLVAVHAEHDGGVRVIETIWDCRSLRSVDLGDAPACFASSGMGDHLVEPRLVLFEEMVVRPGATPERQDAFHAHRWPDRPQISVMMERRGAQTISVTALGVEPAPGVGYRLAMDYRPLAPGLVAGDLQR